MTENEKKLLGRCIKKYRQNNFSQEALAEGICSKYTLSRLENDILCKDAIYHALLEKLGFYYKEDFDIIIVNLIFKDIVSSILVNDIELIISKLNRLDLILSNYNNQIYFTEMKLFLSYLKMHFLDKDKIIFNDNDLIPLSAHNPLIRICVKHVLCENMYLYGDMTRLVEYIIKFQLKEENHILTDFFIMVYHQYNGLMMNAHSIFKNYSHIFVEENNYYQSIRFHLVYSFNFIHKNPEYAISMSNKVKKLIEKSNCNCQYFYLYYFNMVVIYSRQNDIKRTYDYAIEAITKYPKHKVQFLPYVIILSLLLHHRVKNEHLTLTNNKLCDTCIELYQLSVSEEEPEKKMLVFINRNLPKAIGKNNISLPIINLLRKEVIYLVEKSFCYRSALTFDTLIKKYTNEKEY